MSYPNTTTSELLLMKIDKLESRIKELEKSENELLITLKKNKAIENIIKENEEKLRNIFENSTNIFYSHTPDHNLTYLSPQVENILGYTQREALNSWTEFVSDNPINFLGYEKTVTAIETGKRQEPYELELIKKNGEKIWVEVRESPVLENGKTISIVGSLTDITEQKKAEQGLKQSENRFKRLFEDLGDAVFVTRIDNNKMGDIVEVNSAAIKQTGYLKDELLQMNIISDLCIAGSGEISTEDWNEKLLKGDLVSTTEKKRRKDGSEYWTEVIVTSIEFKGEKASLSINRDITERKQADSKLKIALEKATESDRLKSVFLASMSHELRTPLNAIIGFSQIIDDELEISEILEFNQTINQSGKHLLKIVEDLFEITLLESNEVQTEKEDIELISFLNNIHNIISIEQQKLNKTHINLKLQIPSQVQNLSVYSDPAKLKQILLNLLNNALKFTHQGYIKYGFHIETQQSKSILKFYVEDTGIGIPNDNLKFIFDIFRQAEESHTRKHGGIGIGLSIARRLSELIGSEIWVESTVGKGSIFYFSIPINNFKLDDKIKSDIVETKIPQNNKLKEKTVLIVEDDDASYELLNILLKKQDITPIWATNGLEAIKIIKNNRNIDLVLMDINMPQMNGYVATIEIKKFKPDLPIIAQTAYFISDDKRKALDVGCDDYISKPISKKELYRIMENCID